MTTILEPILSTKLAEQIRAASAVGATHVAASIAEIEAMAAEILRHRLAAEWAHPASAPYDHPVLVKQTDGHQMVARKQFFGNNEHGFFSTAHPYRLIVVIGWRPLPSAEET
jgi:hypothetical protein